MVDTQQGTKPDNDMQPADDAALPRQPFSDNGGPGESSGTGEESGTDDAPYAVGYGKPPKTTRFKKGQSGNPRGRKKGTLNFRNYLRAELAAPVTVTVDDRRRTMPKVQLVVKQLVAGAVKGNLRNIEQLMRLLDIMEPEAAQERHGTMLSEEKSRELTDYLALLQDNRTDHTDDQ